MKPIKIIKKNARFEFLPSKTLSGAIPKVNSSRSETSETIVKDWVANWRERKQAQRRDAFAELNRLGLIKKNEV